MTGLGNVFVAAGKKYGVDPNLVVSISGAESSFGKYTSGPHNAWGWGPGIPFGSWEEGISKVTQGLRDGYYDRGLRTADQIVKRYAPASDGNNESQWASNVNSFLKDLGTTVTGTTRGAAATTAASVPSASPGLPPPADFTPTILGNIGKSPELQVRN